MSRALTNKILIKIARHVCCTGNRKSISLGHSVRLAQCFWENESVSLGIVFKNGRIFFMSNKERERVSLAWPVCVTEPGETGTEGRDRKPHRKKGRGKG